MAKRFFRTQTADRPDLAAIGSTSQLDVKGYAFPKIFPLLPVTEKSGVMSVAAAGLTNEAGVEGRTNGTALSTTVVKPIDVEWSTVKIEGRSSLYEDDGAAYASEADADNIGAETAQRKAWNRVEIKAFGKVFTTARANGAVELADHHVIKILQQKAKSLRKYGTPTLVMTTNTWLDFVEIPEIRNRLEKLAGAGNDVGFIMTDIEKVRAAVSTFMGFGSVVLFDSDIVDAAGAMNGKIAVIGLRKVDGKVIEAAKSKAVYGWTAIYIPEEAPEDKPFDMRSFYDNKDKCNVYDAEAYLSPIEVFGESGENKPGSAVVMCKLAASYTELGSAVSDS